MGVCLHRSPDGAPLRSPGVVRFKHALAQRGVLTKDGDWAIDVCVVDATIGPVTVAHTRSELFLNDAPAFRWRLLVSSVAGTHTLSVVEADATVAACVHDVARIHAPGASAAMPPLSAYMTDRYFDW